ncbi:MAG: peptide chain release factor aRF-1 [Candidatus Aenigmarchaeota archaeon]|nr:peptide chain release factor aRF-1 [Candidatus Aenigmarchaeota archaeon]
MSKEDIRKRRLKDLVEELDGFRGRHTELVSLYIPAGYNLPKAAEQINNEKSTAINIKSKAVRKNVVAALERISQHLKLYKQTPENGLVVLSGNISQREGVSDVEIYALEPPEPLKQKLYWCDQKFILDPLKDMIRETEIYGIVVIDKSEAEIGVLHGKRLQKLKHLGSLVPGKTDKGGWSANRYARIREGLLIEFMKKVANVASEQFSEFKDLKGIIVGGPGGVKDRFVENKYMRYDIQKKVISVVDTSYVGEYGLEEAVNRSEEALAEASVMKEKKLLMRFFNALGKDNGLAVYGIKEVMEAVKLGTVEILLVTEKLDWVKASLECSKCGDSKEVFMERKKAETMKCKKCNVLYDIKAEKDLTDEIIKLAEEMSSEVEMISTDTKEGNQLKEIGGIGGILRYKA